MNNGRERAGFTFAELMLVIVILAMAAGLSGVYYVGTYKKTALTSAVRSLLLTGKYARLRAVEDGRPCRLCLDSIRGEFYLSVPVTDAAAQSETMAVVNNPYCRRKTLNEGIVFEYVDVKPAPGESLMGWDSDRSITFYPDGCCDAAVVQLGNGRHSMTAVFSSAYAAIEIYEGSAEMVEPRMQVVDLDAAGGY